MTRNDHGYVISWSNL